MSPPSWFSSLWARRSVADSSSAAFTVRHGCGAGGQEGGRGEARQGKTWPCQVAAATPVRLPLTCVPPQEYGVPFMETSAKTGANVELAFLAIAK